MGPTTAFNAIEKCGDINQLAPGFEKTGFNRVVGRLGSRRR